MKKLAQPSLAKTLKSPFFLVLPAFLIVVIFVYGFTLWNLYISLHKITHTLLGWEKSEFVGLTNYANLFRDRINITALKNTGVIFFIFIPSILVFSFFVAALLDQKIKYENFFKWGFLLPTSIPLVVTATIWRFLYSPEIGFINNVLEWVGLGFLKQPWITSSDQVLMCIFFTSIWAQFGFCSIIYLAYMRSVPVELIESAILDGASTFQIYRHVYFPLLSPATFMLLAWMTRFVLFIVFELVWVMTTGGPAFSSHVLSTFMYYVSWGKTQFGYGAASAEILLILCSGTIAYFIIKSLR